MAARPTTTETTQQQQQQYESKCACGCGETIDKFDKRNRIRRYVKGHQTFNRSLPRWTDKEQSINCDCGCGNQIKKYDSRGRIRYRIPGHHKVKILYSKMCSQITNVKPRQIRNRGRIKLELYYKEHGLPIRCAVNSEDCKFTASKMIYVFYKDHDPYNISIENMTFLCPIHHSATRYVENTENIINEIRTYAQRRQRYMTKKHKWRILPLYPEYKRTFESVTDDATLNMVDNWRNKI